MIRRQERNETQYIAVCHAYDNGRPIKSQLQLTERTTTLGREAERKMAIFD